MKNLYIFILIIIVIFCTGFSDNIYIAYKPDIDTLEELFKSNLPKACDTTYTKVPRGLIISIDESCFFNEGEARIKESSLYILNKIVYLLKNLSNYCVVEDHTQNNDFSKSDYKEDWELSMTRSANIVEYMIKYGHIEPTRIFALGFGEYMPFRDNVAPQKNMENRIDFVIIQYEAKR